MKKKPQRKLMVQLKYPARRTLRISKSLKSNAETNNLKKMQKMF
jgi:hypothetical protein